MEILSKILIGIVALEHLYILYMEMFAWETLGKKTFKGSLKPELFTPTKGLAANQGLYNGFLAAGLIWSLLINDEKITINEEEPFKNELFTFLTFNTNLDSSLKFLGNFINKILKSKYYSFFL